MLQVSFHPFPVLHTPRLLLRRIDMSDAETWYEQRRDKVLMQHIGRSLATHLEDVYELIQRVDKAIESNEAINWAITIPPDDTLIGTIGFVRMKLENHRAEVGYMLGSGQHGKGIMTEALEAVVKYGFEVVRLHSIEGVIAPANLASARVLERGGFIKEAMFKENIFFEGQFLDSTVYSLLAPNK
jgi:ribosomal-protein-alanine N-acetyltransferase